MGIGGGAVLVGDEIPTNVLAQEGIHDDCCSITLLLLAPPLVLNLLDLNS